MDLSERVGQRYIDFADFLPVSAGKPYVIEKRSGFNSISVRNTEPPFNGFANYGRCCFGALYSYPGATGRGA